MELYYHGDDRGVLVIAADGGLNHSTADQFRKGIEKRIDEGLRKIIVDCSQLTYISSLGIGLLLQLHRRMKKLQGDVKICGIRHSAVVNVLKLTRMDKVFEIYPDVDRARDAFGLIQDE